MAVGRDDRERGVGDPSAIELTENSGSETCWPCLAFSAIPAALWFQFNWANDLLAEDGGIKAPFVVWIVGYAILAWLKRKGEVGDAPDVRVFLSRRSLWFKPFNHEAFTCVDLRHVVSVRTRMTGGRALVKFVRIEWALTRDSTRNRIDFVPRRRYRFDANGDNPVCAMILDRAAAIREAEAEANARAAEQREAGVLLDLRDASDARRSDARSAQAAPDPGEPARTDPTSHEDFLR